MVKNNGSIYIIGQERDERTTQYTAILAYEKGNVGICIICIRINTGGDIMIVPYRVVVWCTLIH